MDDLRLIALICVLAGMALGFLPFTILLGITTGFISVSGFMLWRENKRAPGGTSGAMGLTFTVVGTWLCLFIPAWITYVIR
jgi:hypothetical protein